MAIDVRRREAATIIDRIKRGENPVPPELEPEPTVGDLASRCVRAYVNVRCKPKTVKLYRTAIDRHIVPALGTMAVKDVASKALHPAMVWRKVWQRRGGWRSCCRASSGVSVPARFSGCLLDTRERSVEARGPGEVAFRIVRPSAVPRVCPGDVAAHGPK